MTYDDFMDLIKDYCENNIPISINSLFNTLDSIDVIGNKESLLKKKINTINSKYTTYLVSSLELSIHKILSGTVISTDKNSIIINKYNGQEVKIMAVSNKPFSPIILYANIELLKELEDKLQKAYNKLSKREDLTANEYDLLLKEHAQEKTDLMREVDELRQQCEALESIRDRYDLLLKEYDKVCEQRDTLIRVLDRM